MENLILRKSDAVLDNNTFRYENDTLDDARRIVMKRITVYSTQFKKHITVSSEALRESKIRYGNQKLSKNVIRYLQPETIDSVEVITSAAVSGVTREQILALSPVFFLDWSDNSKLAANEPENTAYGVPIWSSYRWAGAGSRVPLEFYFRRSAL